MATKFPLPHHRPWPEATPEQLASGLDLDNEYVSAALDLATRAHQGQFRRGGEPYVGHPIRTALAIAHVYPKGFIGYPLEFMVPAALLHDVLEDAPEFTAELFDSFPAMISGLVEALSKSINGEKRSIGEYYEEIASHPVAGVLKVEDRIDNIFGFSQIPEARAYPWKRRYLDEAANEIMVAAPTLGPARSRLRIAIAYAKANWLGDPPAGWGR